MGKENQTWQEKQQEHKRCLARCDEQAVVLRHKIAASQQHIAEIEARIQAQKQQSNHRLLHWLLNRQLKQLARQRQEVARMLDTITHLDQARQELKEEVEKPLAVRLRQVRVIPLPLEAVFFLLLIGLVGWLVSQCLIHGWMAQ